MVKILRKLAYKNRLLRFCIYIVFKMSFILVALCYLLARIFPIKRNKIVAVNMKGKRYGDNPKYIFDALLEKDKTLDLVWLSNNPEKTVVPEGVRLVKNTFFNEIRELATAKVWVDSNTKRYGTLKRKGQLYIQTWHGSYGLKKIFFDIEDRMPKLDLDMVLHNSKITDLMISNSKKTTQIYKRAFRYEGNILEVGSPRNDIFWDDINVYKDKVNSILHTANRKIALYAPTFRENRSTCMFDMDYEQVREALSTRFGGEWVILVRLHPNNIEDAKEFMTYDENIINATEYDVMQELLVAADVLITDYSSCMLDFATRGKICFLYAKDVESYRKERDYYFDLNELPFPLGINNKELVGAIQNFNEETYAVNLKNLFEQVGLHESGHASEAVAKYIIDYIGGNN